MMLQEISPSFFHIEYHNVQPENKDVLLCYRKGSVLLHKAENGELTFPTVGEVDGGEFDFSAAGKSKRRQIRTYTYLFAVDRVRFFCAAGPPIEEFSIYRYEHIKCLRNAQPAWAAFAAATGYHLWWWYQKNQFCGACGKEMLHSEKERAMYCPVCGNTAYPMIAPSVIVAVLDGNRILLTRYQPSHNSYSHYALIAGYVEAGETPEDTVRREVMEEVGLKVKNIRYYKSQPWGFTGTLLLGFFCEADGSTNISLDEEELSEAVWVERSAMPDRSTDTSLTSEMMEQFRLGCI